jgi:hypothetical protein
MKKQKRAPKQKTNHVRRFFVLRGVRKEFVSLFRWLDKRSSAAASGPTQGKHQ